MTTARREILARIRAALSRRGARAPAPASQPFASSALAARACLPDGGSALDERLEILARNLATLRAELHRVPDLEAAAGLLARLARSGGWRRVACHAHPDVERASRDLPCDAWRVDATFDKHRLEACDAAVTTCEALVSQTGAILVSSATCGGRALTILPPVHVVVARVEQIVPDLAEAFARARARHGPDLPSMLSFIAGPSRTADIERTLVLGAHGPKELHVVLIDEGTSLEGRE